MSKGILSVVSGFSGAGKGTMVNELLKRYDNYAVSISVTTRNPREGEVDGKSYFFRSTEYFEKMIQEDALLEHAKYVNNYYGTPRSYVENMLNEGKDVILEIELQGAMQVKAKFPEAVLIFVVPPSIEILKQRLIGRGTETAEVIEARLNRAAEEAEGIDAYDYVIVNDILDESVERMHNVLQSEHNKMKRNLSVVEKIKQEALALKK